MFKDYLAIAAIPLTKFVVPIQLCNDPANITHFAIYEETSSIISSNNLLTTILNIGDIARVSIEDNFSVGIPMKMIILDIQIANLYII